MKFLSSITGYGGVIALLLWLYLSAQIFLFGAEFAAVYSRLLDEKRAAIPVPSQADPPHEAVEPPERTPAPPSPVSERADLARGTVVGLVGVGVAAGLALVGLLAAGFRLLARPSTADSDPGPS